MRCPMRISSSFPIATARHRGPAVKVKKMQTISDARGEFVFRVPTGPMRYIDHGVPPRATEANGNPHGPEGEEHIEVTFQLEPESK